MFKYLEFAEKPNGLVVRLTPEGREYLKEKYWNDVDCTYDFDTSDSSIFADLSEYQLCNGWTMLAAEEIGALTGCEIILSNDIGYEPEVGMIVRVGAAYWHERYQVEDAIEKLLEGELFLLKA